MQPVSTLTTYRAKKLQGSFIPPGDKSISHRAIFLSALGKGKARITHFLAGEDCQATAKAFQAMGVPIRFHSSTDVEVEGVGKQGLKKPSKILDCGNSGTTMRLLLGVLAGQNFPAELMGDVSLSSRPMKRVVEPLTQMGARFSGPKNAEYPPIKVQGSSRLKAMTHKLKIASAQVKSALLLAGLNADGKTTVAEPVLSRDHTERMMRYFGVPLEIQNLSVSIDGKSEVSPRNLRIPGDISSSSFFIAAAALFPKSQLRVLEVGLNPTRTAFLDVLKKMGAQIEITPAPGELAKFEPVGEILIRGGELHGVEISGELIPHLIDEIPILAVAGALAHDRTVIRNAEELRVKETDRIKTMVQNLRALGVRVEELADGMIIEGPTQFKGGVIPSFGDHRVAMAMAIAGLFAEDKIKVEDTACIQTSFPEFESILNSLVQYA